MTTDRHEIGGLPDPLVEMAERVEFGDKITITRLGQPVAVIISAAEYDDLRQRASVPW